MKDSGLTKVKNIDIQDEDLYLALRKYNKALPKGKTPMKVQISLSITIVKGFY